MLGILSVRKVYFVCFSFFPSFMGAGIAGFPALLCVCPVNHSWAWARGTRKCFPAVATASSFRSGFEGPHLGGALHAPPGQGGPPSAEPAEGTVVCMHQSRPQAVRKRGRQRPQPNTVLRGGCPSTHSTAGSWRGGGDSFGKKKRETVKKKKKS